MILSIATGLVMSKPSLDDQTERGAHLLPEEVAAYLDRVANETERVRIEAHLGECEICRAEVLGLRPIVSGQVPLHRVAPWLAVAAAAIILMVAWPRATGTPDLIHRESPIAATVSPRALAPSGQTGLPLTLRWSSVPLANNYLARIYDAQGVVLFERETTDTLLLIGRIGLRPETPYYWKVEARSGFDRSTSSALTEFTVRSSERP